MSNSSRYVPKLNDRDVIRAFESVAARFPEHGPVGSFQDPFGELQGDAVDNYKGLHGYFLNTAVLRVGHCVWQWQRIKPENNDANSARHDRLTFSWNPQQGQPDRLLVAAISAALDGALARPLASINQDDGETGFYASHSEVLLAMESTAANVLTEAASHRQGLENAYLKKEEALNARVDERQARELIRIAEEKARIDAELGAQREALDERQRSLDQLQKALDDRNNTHVRREIRASLLQLTKDRLANFAVSKETRTQYVAVHVVSVAGLAALALASVWYGSRISVDPETLKYPPETIALAIKSGLLAATAVALGSWYLGWLNRWLQRIADAEFRLQQFRLDIERASWLAETVLEWKTASADPFPDLLASRLSAGLFHASATDVDDPKTPATHLAEALFGAASSAKLKLGEQEVSFDRKSVRELAK